MGHVEVDKMVDSITKSYWFLNIRRKAQNHVVNCPKCIAFSKKSGKTEGFLHSNPKGANPFKVIQIDHNGPINSKNTKIKHLLVVIDGCRKFVKLYATKTTSSKEAIEALQNYFHAYSRPKNLESDRVSCFTSNEFDEFLSHNNINHI